MNLSRIVEWIISTGRQFVDARKLARRFNINTYTAGKMLKELHRLGYVEVYRKRKGRFTIYRTNNRYPRPASDSSKV